MREDVAEYDYLLDTKYFADIDAEDIQKGKVKVHLTVEKRKDFYEMHFDIDGVVSIPCDRCLDEMDLPVETEGRLVVKFGKDYAEESDETVIIPEREGAINLAWFLYEFVALAIPARHVHAPGKCNRQMTDKLRKHTPKTDDDDEQLDETDNPIITGEDQNDTEY
jgi:uncharacterized metal-binding protein YceD (DUF177 family)